MSMEGNSESAKIIPERGFTFLHRAIISGLVRQAAMETIPMFSRRRKMDPENLKQIIDALTTVGGDAKEALIWYIVMNYLPSLLWSITGPLLILVAIRSIYHSITYGLKCDKRYAVLARLTKNPDWCNSTEVCNRIQEAFEDSK